MSRAAAIVWLAASVIAIALLSIPLVAFAASSAVTIQNFAFAPNAVTIRAGDTVTWTNKDAAAHSAKFSDAFQTAVLGTNQSGSLTFANPGTFPYICGIHGASMSGTIVVQAVATPPPTAPPPTPPPPTPVPTVRTPAPTAPTAAPTTETTAEPSATPSGTPTPAASSAAPVAAGSPSSGVSASPVAAAVTPAPKATEGNPAPLIVGGAALAVVALGALAFRLARRG